MSKVFLFLVIINLFFLLGDSSIVTGDSREMKEVYHIDGNLSYIDGVEFPVKREIDILFAVPEKNAVGTNALDNAITLLKFNNGQLRYDTVRKNFKKYVYGGDMVFLPQFSENTIGYSQTRGFLLFNIKDKTFRSYSIGKIFQITIDDVFPIDGEKKVFLFQLNHQIGFDKNVKELALIDLTADEPNVLASFDIDKDPLHAKLGNTTFYFTEENGKRNLHALNEKLQIIDHPLYSVYNNKHESFGRFGYPVIHPKLPFAIFSEVNPKITENLITLAASWHDDNKKINLYKIFGDNLAGLFQFSPDGKWLLFQDDTIKENMLMIMPVDSNLPHFLGRPIMLQCDEEMPRDLKDNYAWISDPLSFVLTLEDKIIKWDISETSIHRKIGR